MDGSVKLRRLFRDQNLLVLDFILIAATVIGSLVLRLELVQFFLDFLPDAALMILVAWVVKPLVYRRFGMYQRVWAYASMQELRLIVKGVSAASLIMALVMIMLRFIPGLAVLPRSVFVIDWVLSLLAAGGARIGIRLLAEAQPESVGDEGRSDRQVLIVGAGDAGALVVRELQKNPQIQLEPIAFLDDDLEKQGRQIYGVPVVGRLGDLAREIEGRSLHEVIIAIPSAPGSVVRKVAEVCRAQGVPFRTMPGIYELLGGEVSVNRLREVDITDLLRRKPVRIEHAVNGLRLAGKRVLVTGAGGSIASELCRQIGRLEPAEVVLLGHGENSIFNILLELEETFPGLALHALVADIRDEERLKNIFEDYRPEVIFHAAAHKHVHLMEMNVTEAVTNNIIGTRNMVAAAQRFETDRLVMISTDKAVQPTSVMGASKRVAEMIVLDAANRSGRAFSVVRFGNVLGSRGSVVPLFERQIAQGGPLTVRHVDIERYFMTIPEAVHLVLQASAMGANGEMFVLNMGEPVKIMDLAEDMIRLSGLEPGEDIEIVITGMRPGEKLTEELWDEDAEYLETQHPDIRRVNEPQMLRGKELEQTVAELSRLAKEGDTSAIIKSLGEIIPGAAIRSTPPPELRSAV